MLNFIVLGIVPGTSVQINFSIFMLGLALLCLPALLLALYRERTSNRRMKNAASDKQQAIELVAL